MKRISALLVSFFILLLGALFLSSCQNDRPEKSAEEEFLNDVALDSFFTRLHQQNQFNGSVAVKKKGELIFKKAYGTANFDLNTPFLPSTVMEVASVSKQFTAAAILILQQDGKLKIEDPLTAYLGEDFPYPDIHVKHLLTHTSGLPDYEKYFRENWDTDQIVYNSDILNYFKTEKPELMSAPGEKYHYSNSGYVLLASIVQAVSDKSLDIFLKERVFDLAEMKNSGFYDRDAIWKKDNYAPGYLRDPHTCNFTQPDSLPGRYYYRFLSGRLGPGRLSSTVEDLIKWDSILYTDKVLNEQSKKLAFTAHPPSQDPSDYGFGWHVTQTDSINEIFHTGSWAGNLSFIKRYLDSQDLVVILNNTYNSAYMKDIRAAVDRYVKDETPLELPPVKAEVALKNDICDLDKSSILQWKEEYAQADWNKEQLKKLADKYEENEQKDKAEIVQLLIDSLE